MQAQAHVIPYSRPAASTNPPVVESTKCHSCPHKSTQVNLAGVSIKHAIKSQPCILSALLAPCPTLH
eukprot:scaffold13839_cov131-Skeletonema_marinoi.AAC.2